VCIGLTFDIAFVFNNLALKSKENKKETSFVLAPEASRPSLSLALLSKFPSKTENADGHAHGCAFIESRLGIADTVVDYSVTFGFVLFICLDVPTIPSVFYQNFTK
jgi:hypothetical protein